MRTDDDKTSPPDTEARWDDSALTFLAGGFAMVAVLAVVWVFSNGTFSTSAVDRGYDRDLERAGDMPAAAAP